MIQYNDIPSPQGFKRECSLPREMIENSPVDITDEMSQEDLGKIIKMLLKYQSEGYERLYWDGYDSFIYLYKKRR